MRVLPSGSTALLVELEDLDQVLGLYGALAEEPLAGVVDVVPAARTVLLVTDPAVVEYSPGLPVLGLPGSAFLRQAEDAGLPVVAEAFADRAYTPQGTLVPRRLPGAVLHDADEIARRCVAMATGQPVADVDGGELHLSPDSICVHGDTPGAVDIARRVRAELEHAGVALTPFS